MSKQIFRFILSTLLFVAVLLIPSSIILLTTYYVADIIGYGRNSFIFLYIITVMFIAIMTFIVIIARKKTNVLFALPIGFLVTPLFCHIWMSLFDVHYGSGFGGKGLAISIVGFMYALPFVIVTFFIAIITKALSSGKKNKIPLKTDES